MLIDVESRNAVGKKASKIIRDSGKVPGIIYGPGQESIPITFIRKHFVKLYNEGELSSKVVTLNIDNGKKKVDVVLQDIDAHSPTDTLIHADFLVIDNDTEVRVSVPIKLIGQDVCLGMKLGGKLNLSFRHLQVRCLPKLLPEYITIDISEMEIGDKIRFSTVKLPEGVKLVSKDLNCSIATIKGKKTKSEEEDEKEELEEI